VDKNINPMILNLLENEPDTVRNFLIRTISECSREFLEEFFMADLGLEDYLISELNLEGE